MIILTDNNTTHQILIGLALLAILFLFIGIPFLCTCGLGYCIKKDKQYQAI